MSGKFEIKQSVTGQYHFNLKAGNGQVILTSGMYATKLDAQKAIEGVRQYAAVDARFERRTSHKSEPYFVLTAPDGKLLGKSEMYSSANAMDNGIASVKRHAADADTIDTTV